MPNVTIPSQYGLEIRRPYSMLAIAGVAFGCQRSTGVESYLSNATLYSPESYVKPEYLRFGDSAGVPRSIERSVAL